MKQNEEAEEGREKGEERENCFEGSEQSDHGDSVISFSDVFCFSIEVIMTSPSPPCKLQRSHFLEQQISR